MRDYLVIEMALDEVINVPNRMFRVIRRIGIDVNHINMGNGANEL